MNIKVPACVYHFILLVWLGSLFLLGIWNYKIGFLLSRTIVENVSHCDDFTNDITLKPWLDVLGPRERIGEKAQKKGCWVNGRFQKAVVLLIDGLRFDFAFTTNLRNDKNEYFNNKMDVFRKALTRAPQNVYLAPFIADPPTTTLQRLQGLTTGTLPTFIDAGSNFGSDAIKEDNIVSQAKQFGKKIVFLGDDTWKDLFPNQFHRSFFYPSFNVKDLDTVDNGIMDHLPRELQNKDWDILIAHFLGVDHCGHRYGPSHPEMERKLKQINNIIKEVMKNLPRDTILFVLGDHGMTSTGDHGGDSIDEVSSTFFAFSKGKIRRTVTENIDKLIPMAQVNFVPTFSLLLGLPIPFSSLGTIVPDLFHPIVQSNSTSILQELIYSTLSALANAKQVQRYLHAANLKTDLKWTEIEKSLVNISHINDHELKPVLAYVRRLCLNFINEARGACSAKWAKFNVPLMCLGMFIVLLSTSVSGILLFKTCYCQVRVARLGFWIVSSYSATLPVSILPFIFGYSLSGYFLVDVLNTLAFVSLTTVLLQLWRTSSRVSSAIDEKETSSTFNNVKVETIFSAFSLFLHFIVFFSNSFVIHEDSIVAFLAQSIFVVFALTKLANLFRSKSKPKHTPSPFSVLKPVHWMLLGALSPLFLVALRVGDLFRKCREEHGPSCENSMLIVALHSIPEEWWSYRNARLFLALFAILIALGAFVYLVTKTKQMFLNDLTAVLISYAVPFITVCICANWIMGLAPKKTLDKLLPKKQEVPAQSAAILSVVSILLLIAVPISVTVNPLVSRPKWARFHLTMLINKGLILVALLLLALLFSGDGLALALITIVIATVVWCLLWLILNNEKSENGSSFFNFAVMLSALSSHSFFATGHQAVFSAIHWNAAFVVSAGESNDRILPAISVIFETFCVQMLLILLLHGIVSLTELAKHYNSAESMLSDNILSYGVRGILPSLKKSSNNPNVGFLSRYENSLLNLQLSFLLCQAIKMLGAIIASFVLRRHLMVWKIFAPRVIFEASSFFITVSTMLGCQLLTTRYLLKLEDSS